MTTSLTPTRPAADAEADAAVRAGHLAVLVAYSRVRRPRDCERELLANGIARLAAELHALEQRSQVGSAEPEPEADDHLATGPADYHVLVGRVKEMVTSTVPPGTHLAIISRGDPELLQVPGRTASHFPGARDGGYAGFYPKDGQGALLRLDASIAAGARYLVIPETGRWWLEYYGEFGDYLRSRCRAMIDEPDIGVIFELPASQVGGEPEAESTRGLR